MTTPVVTDPVVVPDASTIVPGTDSTKDPVKDPVKADEKMIPYDRFNEVNTKYQELKKIQDAADAEKLKKEGNYEELLKKMKDDYEAKIAEYTQKDKESAKTAILTKYSVPEQLKSLITGSTPEEIEAQVKLLASNLKTPVKGPNGDVIVTGDTPTDESKTPFLDRYKKAVGL